MKLPLFGLLLASALLCGPAFAGKFEGTIEMKMSSPEGGGKMLFSVGPAGVRTDTELKANGTPVEMTVLLKGAQPKTAILINSRQKSYSEVDLDAARQAAAKQSPKWTGKKVGTEKVGPYTATHVVLTTEQGETMDVWTTKELDVDPTVLDSMSRAPGDNQLLGALEKVGAKGFMVKMVSPGKAGPTTVELVKVDKRALPKGTFDIPAGYTKSAAPGPMMMTPEQQKQMEESLRNMTPEQRKMVEEMMKKQKGK